MKTYKEYVSLRFLDSFSFLNSSLADLVKNLKGNLPIQDSFYPKQPLLKQKGVFPYEWWTDISKMNDTSLPLIGEFYSKLNGCGITDEDYARAHEVWKHFNMKTMRDYHNLYLECDTLQLADVFETYRDIAIDQYGLDPVYYYSTPNYAWDALLRNTRFINNKPVFNKNFEGEPLKLELLTDPDMVIMFTFAIRGGINQVGQLRYAKADGNYSLLYLDANNLYGWAMTQYLPIGDFAFANEKDILTVEKRLKRGEYFNENDKTGLLLMVDLDYPEEIQDSHLDLPLAPESLCIRGEWLSDKQREYYGNNYVNSIPKLCTTFFKKEKYCCFLENLQFYLKQGLKLTKIHKIISFRQIKWMEPYIMYNTKLRTNAKNDFEKDFYKLMNNAVFGKTMENVQKYKDIKICNPENILKYTSSPLLHYWNQISDSMIIVHNYKSKVVMNKPIYVGAKILDLSKLLMYDFFYNYLKPKFGDRVKLIYTDTDSFVLFIKTNDLDTELLPDLDKFDTSEYPTNHIFRTQHPDKDCNKKVIGKFKNEMAESGKLNEMTEFIALRSKCYSFKRNYVDDSPKAKPLIKAKGIVKSVAKKELTFDKFKAVLDSGVDNDPVKQTRIVSKKHQLYTITEMKRNLGYYDDKKYSSDGIHNYPLGYYKNNVV